MSLAEFSRDVVPVLQLALSVLGIVSLFLVWYQIRQATIWNRVSTHHLLLGYLPGEDLEKAVLKVLTDHGVAQDAEVAADVAVRLYAAPDFVVIKTFLNKYEHFCAAINVGAIDPENAYALHSGRVIYVHRIYGLLIDHLRGKRGPQTYIEIERVATRWQQRRKNDEATTALEIQRLRERQEGVRRRI